MVWHKVYFNNKNIKHRTEKAMLLKFPHESHLSGYKFWEPKKMITKEDSKGQLFSFIATDQWEFRIFKEKRGFPTDEQTVNIQDVSKAFDSYGFDYSFYSEKSYYIEDEPKEIKGWKVEVDESLKR